MNIYTIDENGYITETKRVGGKYIKQELDIEGIPNYKVGYHHETGEKKPLTQIQIDNQRIIELKELISNKKLLDMDSTTEQVELKELLGL